MEVNKSGATKPGEGSLLAALSEARDTFVEIQAEPLDTPRGWLIKRCRRATERIDAALAGEPLSVEWVEDGVDQPGWFICDADGPVEGSYALRSEAEEARRVRA